MGAHYEIVQKYKEFFPLRLRAFAFLFLSHVQQSPRRNAKTQRRGGAK